MTWSRDQTGYKYPALSHNYSRRNSFTLNFEFLCTSLLTLPNLFFLRSVQNYSKTFSDDVFAKFQLLLVEIILRHFQVISLPKLPSPYLLSPYTYHESKQCPLTLASVLGIAWKNFGSKTRVNTKLHNPHKDPQNRFNWRYIDQVSPRLLRW